MHLEVAVVELARMCESFVEGCEPSEYVREAKVGEKECEDC